MAVYRSSPSIFLPVILLSVSSLIVSASAQLIDPSTVPLSTKENWCTLQTATCPLLCPQIGGSLYPNANTCNSTTLIFSCICSNAQSPNASQYTQTIPYFECTTANDQCADNCDPHDSACVSNCRTSRPCGAQDPPKGNKTRASGSMSSGAAATTSSGMNGKSTAMATGFGGPQSSDAGRVGAKEAVAVMVTMGAIIMGGMMGGMATLML